MRTVLLLGDSIAGGLTEWGRRGYARLVEAALAGTWTIATLPENGGDSRHVLANLDAWLALQPVDLIHVNCGLHDVRRHPETHALQVPLDEYGANLCALVGRLRCEAAAVIWARTTPVRDNPRDIAKYFVRCNADVEAYNGLADSIMAAAGIPVNDLYTAIVEAGVDMCIAEDGIHMTPYGAQILSTNVITALHEAHRRLR